MEKIESCALLRVLKSLKIVRFEKEGGRRSFQSLLVIGINVLVNELLRYFSNLTAVARVFGVGAQSMH